MDLKGRKFYSLEVIEKIPDKRINGSVAWKCKCDCGKIIEVNTKQLTSHRKKSCGCTRYRTYVTGKIKKFSTNKKLLEEILKTNYEILELLKGDEKE